MTWASLAEVPVVLEQVANEAVVEEQVEEAYNECRRPCSGHSCACASDAVMKEPL